MGAQSAGDGGNVNACSHGTYHSFISHLAFTQMAERLFHTDAIGATARGGASAHSRRPNVLPLTRAVLHTAGARLGNDTPSMTANGTASGAAAELDAGRS